MKRLTKYMVLVMILLLAVALMTGCCIDDKVTGGGWFINTICGETYGAKCTFGFNAHGEGCLCDGIDVKGQFQFNDHKGNKIHVAVLTLEQESSDTYIFTGEAKEGTVKVTVVDKGQLGADKGDEITVEYDDDTWEGVLGGGNIVIH